MSANERAFYEDVETAVTQYALEKDVSHRFLLSSPQRVLTSSMSATLAHWRRGAPIDSEEAEDNLAETSQIEPVGPLIEHLRKATAKWSVSLLKSDDTKYDALIAQLSNNFKDEKIVLFSTFKQH